jgi:hypothetical protein
MMKKPVFIFCILLLLFCTLPGCNRNDSRLHDGDLIFQSSHSTQSRAIEIATKSKFSHMGIVLTVEGRQMIYEAVGPVQYTPLKQWIKRGIERHFTVRRLKNADSILTPEHLAALKKAGEELKGKPYDFVFGWSDEKVYCSELIWKMYDRALHIHIGELQYLRDFDLSNPIVREKIQERYPNGAPLDEAVISPERMFSSNLLETVVEE